jgi:hypothetical protein
MTFNTPEIHQKQAILPHLPQAKRPVATRNKKMA